MDWSPGKGKLLNWRCASAGTEGGGGKGRKARRGRGGANRR